MKNYKEKGRKIIDGNISVVIDVAGKLLDVRIPPTQPETRVISEAVYSKETLSDTGEILVVGGELLEPEQTETITRPTTREDIDRILEEYAAEILANVANENLLKSLI